MKVIAIDLGLKRIGLAYSGGQDIVTPLEAVERKNRNQASAAVKKIIADWEADAVVVPDPLADVVDIRPQRLAQIG
ncbi:Holliday junction resolvase RuvX, partial [bacterium]|nr:Holliday junction resolvase RuvX [bacterium]